MKDSFAVKLGHFRLRKQNQSLSFSCLTFSAIKTRISLHQDGSEKLKIHLNFLLPFCLRAVHKAILHPTSLIILPFQKRSCSHTQEAETLQRGQNLCRPTFMGVRIQFISVRSHPVLQPHFHVVVCASVMPVR